jgi:phosphatidylserine/phosphatidylglycerophosphate/cardiolipin synthase-like enzyme/regulation of enolase protein 1 (concanavalin A-like superfamily)
VTRANLFRTICASAFAALMLFVLPSRANAAETLCDPSFQDCRQQLLNLINAETNEIDVGLWFMEDARYSTAIINRFHAGVQVRILMDPRVFPQDPTDQDVMNQLASAGIPMRKRIASGIEHWKAMIFAHQATVYFGSANFSPAAFVPQQPYVNYTDETVYVTTDASIVNSFMTKFDDAWVDATNYATWANPPASLVRHYPKTSIDPEMNFPPGEDYANRSVSRYNAEKHKIDVVMFRITDQRHTNAMIAAKGRGVAIRMIVDPGEYRNRSRIWDAWNVDRLYAAGIPIRITTHQGENHGKLVLLYGQGMTIFGSSNWSTPSANSQHEHNYFTTKTNIFSWFENYFNRRWNNTNPIGAKETGAFVPLPPGTPTYHTPANGATGVATSGTKLVWDGGAWAHVYDIYFGTTSTPHLFLANQNLGPDDPTKSPKQLQSVALPTLAPGTKYYWQIVSKTMANVSKVGPIWSFTTAGTATASNLPSPWTDGDIGSVPIAGSAQYSSGTFTVRASGADIWGAADAFHFVYHALTGDGSIQARVGSVQETSTWAKAGVMIRESLAANAKHAFMLVSAAKGVAMQWRPATGGSTLNVTGSASAPPRWVRLVRSGSTITGYESSDGSTWKAVSSQTISMASTVYIGLAVTSHSTSASTTATITNVS